MKPVQFPPNWTTIVKGFPVKLPRLRTKKAAKGRLATFGTRLTQYGATLEEQYIALAPAEGTTPEKLVYGWLIKHNFLFGFQETVAGGRVPGGAIIDFLIYDKVPNIAIRVMSYWHASAEAQWADAVQEEMLTEAGMQVEDLWDYDLNTLPKVDQKMREVLFGAPKNYGGAPATSTFGERCPICGDPMCTRCSW